MAPSGPPLVKICGLSTEDALDAAVEAGAERVGLVFFPRSPRHLALPRAAALASRVRGRAAIVALTVDADDAALDAIAAAVAPDMLQLHGRETPGARRRRAGEARPARDQGARRVDGRATSPRPRPSRARPTRSCSTPSRRRAPRCPAATASPSTGRSWPALTSPSPFMLSGGLGPRNVGEALRVTRAPAVDVSSGVETAPGVKSPELIAAFVRAARGGMPDEDLQP